MHISSVGFESPSGIYRSFDLFTCVDEDCFIVVPVAPVPINDAFADPPLPDGSNLYAESLCRLTVRMAE